LHRHNAVLDQATEFTRRQPWIDIVQPSTIPIRHLFMAIQIGQRRSLAAMERQAGKPIEPGGGSRIQQGMVRENYPEVTACIVKTRWL